MDYKIATLAVNPAIDLSTSIDRLEPFHKLRCVDAKRDPGGGGINVARVLRRFGLPALTIYPAGGCTGDLLQQLLEREGVESYVIPIKGDTREDFTVIDRRSGEEFRFVLPGPALEAQESQRILDAVRDFACRTEFLIASGSLPQDAPGDFFARIAAIAASCGTRLILDTSGPALSPVLAQPIFLLKLSLREFQELTDRPLDTPSQRMEAAGQLLRQRNIEIIALTLGNEGAILASREKAWFGTAPRIKRVSTVGAGDSFLGALIWRLTLGRGMDEALRYGIAAGSAALLAPGTELCRIDDVTRLLPQVTIQDVGERGKLLSVGMRG